MITLFRRWFLDRPLNQKLVLIFSIPVLFLVSLSIFTVLVFKKFENAEDLLERSILIRSQAIYYLERLYFVQNAFRGYVLTGARSFLSHYDDAKGDIDLAGLELARLVKDSPVRSHGDTVINIQSATRQLLGEKDAVIARMETGAEDEGLAYIKSGRGLDLVDRISSLLDLFQSDEAQLQKKRQAAVEAQREIVIWVIVGEGVLILLLSGLGVMAVARSVTKPMSALAGAAEQIGQAGTVTFPDANRLDEVGLLSRSMAGMDRQIRAQIADLKQSESMLRELSENLSLSEHRYRSLVEHAPLGIFTTTRQAWAFANPFECELMGLAAGVTPSFEHWRKALHPDDLDRVTREFRYSVEREVPFESEFRFVRPDGSVRHILSRGIPVQNSPVGESFYLCLDLDVTQMVELQERLAPAERLATLTRMATSIAHDLRTPLLGLEQGLQGLKYVADRQLDHESKQLLQDLHTGARLAVGVVQDILDLYRQAYGELPLSYSRFHFDEVAREVIELMAAEVRDRRLTISIQGEGHEVWADRRRLFRVMVNLMENAVKNSPAGGRIDVVLTRQEGRLSVAVEDEGRGFGPGALDELFEPSRPVSTPTRGGTGLGLYLCRLVIGAHGGIITAGNRSEGGARFTFEIPIDGRKAPDGHPHFDSRRSAPVQAQSSDGA
jgi:PAS domain S-box-containing protein